MMKKLTLLLMFSGCAEIALAQIADPAIAINSTQISRAKVQAQADHLLEQRGMNYGGITQPGVFKQVQQEVVDQLIVQELLWQEAQRRDFVVDDSTVNARLAELKGRFDTEQAFLFKIEAGGFTEESYAEEIRQQMSVRQMISEDIAPSVKVTDQDVRDFYEDNLHQMHRPEEIHASHILIRPNSDDSDGMRQAEEEASRILETLRDGADFAELARSRSQGNASEAGDLGYFRHGQMIPAFEVAAFALEPGEVSEVVRTQFGFHIIRLEDRRGGDIMPLAEVSGSIRAYLAEQRLREEVESLVLALRESGDVQIHLRM